MSEENVEIFRRGLAGWNREGVAGVLPFFSDDVVAIPFPEWPADSVYKGTEEFRRLAAEWTDQFDEYSWEEVRVIGAGDTVVGLVIHRGRIKGTTVQVEQPMGTVWKIADGKGEEVRFFLTWAEALRSAGLPADAATP